MDGHEDDRRIEGETEEAGEVGPGREVVADRGVQSRRPDDVDAGRVLAHRDHPLGVLVVADEVEVAELGDGVAKRVVEGTERLLAAVEMDDRNALQGRRERGCGRLEPVPDQQQRIRRRPPQRGPDRFERRGGLGSGWRVLGRVVVAGPRQDDVGFEAIRPDVVDRVAVSSETGASRRRAAAARGRDAPGSRRPSSAGSPSPGGRS